MGENGAVSPIFITGCARSGTSLIAGIIHGAGAWGGDMSGPSKNNPRGFFENREIRDDVIKPYLQRLGADPLGQDPLPNPKSVIRTCVVESFPMANSIASIIKKQGYSGGPWFYKGAKMCLIWQAVHLAFPGARWVVVRRPDEDIVDSCMRTPFMNAFDDKEGWCSWVNHHTSQFQSMREVLSPIEVWSNRAVVERHTYLTPVLEKLGLSLDAEKINEFIDESLFHH